MLLTRVYVSCRSGGPEATTLGLYRVAAQSFASGVSTSVSFLALVLVELTIYNSTARVQVTGIHMAQVGSSVFRCLTTPFPLLNCTHVGTANRIHSRCQPAETCGRPCTIFHRSEK